MNGIFFIIVDLCYKHNLREKVEMRHEKKKVIRTVYNFNSAQEESRK